MILCGPVRKLHIDLSQVARPHQLGELKGGYLLNGSGIRLSPNCQLPDSLWIDLFNCRVGAQ